jgi:hypothetical protein
VQRADALRITAERGPGRTCRHRSAEPAAVIHQRALAEVAGKRSAVPVAAHRIGRGERVLPVTRLRGTVERPAAQVSMVWSRGRELAWMRVRSGVVWAALERRNPRAVAMTGQRRMLRRALIPNLHRGGIQARRRRLDRLLWRTDRADARRQLSVPEGSHLRLGTRDEIDEWPQVARCDLDDVVTFLPQRA